MPSAYNRLANTLAKVLAHALDIVEYGAPLRRWIRLCRTISSHGDRELHSRVSGVVVDNVQLPLWIRIVKASLQSIEQILVKEFQLNRDGYPLTQPRTF
jgi:hypothetical protein